MPTALPPGRAPRRRARSSNLLAALALGGVSSLAAPASAQVGAAPAAVAAANSAILRGDYAQAEREVATIKGGSGLAQALLVEARIQLATGRYSEAVATGKTAAGLGLAAKIEAAPLRAQGLAAQGKRDEAIAVLKEVEGEADARRARLLLGELLIATGRRGLATAPLKTLIEDWNNDSIKATDPEGITLVARALHLLRRHSREANETFNAAEKAGGKTRVETLLWRAELFLDTYDPGDAGQVVKDALKLAPRDPLAHVAMARVKLENALDFAGAESEVTQALEVNPNLASAYFVRAGLALRDMDLVAADAAADRGLAVTPTDLELLSMKAAIRFLADDRPGFDAAKARVFALDPEYSTFFQIVGEYAEWEHRYDDIVKMMGEATALDKDNAKAHATLGLNLIRAGDDDGGLKALRTAWDKDHFNVRVFNTLNLYEKDLATDYVTVDGQPFRIRYNKEEKAILERYVPRMLTEAWGSMVQRYGFTPKTPVSIELYADTQSFSIRTSGLPNVGIQGVCFGQTLAALSPRAAPFNWGNVLWHELGHVFAIQLSKNHVPRWFTEGLSEYETIVRRPEWKREEEPALFAALKAGRIPAVGAFNRAFTHVDSTEDVTMAYYAASQILVFLGETYGFPKIVAMLPRWANGERTPEVVKETLGITSEELDQRFRTWLTPRLARYTKMYVPDLHAPPLDDARKAVQKEPKNAKRYVELSLALLGDGQKPEADATLGEALRLDPKQPDAHYVKLKLALAAKDYPEAKRLLDKMVVDGNDGYAVRMKAADLAETQKDLPRMKQSLEAASRFDPSQQEPQQALFDLAHKQKDAAGELAALRAVAQLDQHDRRVWGMLLQRLVERGLWEEARAVGESAMFIDVQNPKVHRLYARALARTGNFVSAIFELNSALVCKPPAKDQAEIYGELATGYKKLRQDDLARQAHDLQKQLEAVPAPAPPAGRDPSPEPPIGT